MLIGREQEKQSLLTAYKSPSSEFVAVYGRRRVGKTFLIRETFDNHFSFSHTGLAKANMRTQLQEFHHSLLQYGSNSACVPATWAEAFHLLEATLDASDAQRKVLFIDEMPWMDTPRAGFLSALEHFWNGWAAARKDILLIICGSASSWIINKIVKNHGGLHNRITRKIHLHPFCLRECQQYARHLRLPCTTQQIAEGYMAMGGIPFYWSQLDKRKSMAQNINQLFFSNDGALRHEFNELYASLFDKPDNYIKIISTLATKKCGMTRAQIITTSRLPDNGALSQMLDNLVLCGFLRQYHSFGKLKKDTVFQLIDNYTLFYYQFLHNSTINDPDYWLKIFGTPTYNTWCGLAFERICLQHTEQIKRALGISGILTSVGAWQTPASSSRPGAQVDLIIDRNDGAVNICEMKYSQFDYSITAAYHKSLANKLAVFAETTKTTKALRLTMITSNKLNHNQYADIVTNEISLINLFD